MAVLPNRFLVKLDPTTDWFKAYQPHHGVLRLTIDRATGIAGFWGTQLLPFHDPASHGGFVEYERLVYRSLAS